MTFFSYPICLNKDLYEINLTHWCRWEPDKAPHALIVGSTGSGKTYFSKLFLGKIAYYNPDARLYVCDFKGDDDFSFLTGNDTFYRFDKCQSGFHEFYQLLINRQKGIDTSREMRILFFDEWASYLNYIDKKEADAEKKKLATLLMLGRSYNIHIIISQQRADAQYFSASRDNFNLIIGLGNLSKESVDMLFHDYKEEIAPNKQRGTGYMLINGSEFTNILVPTVTNHEKLHATISSIVNKP